VIKGLLASAMFPATYAQWTHQYPQIEKVFVFIYSINEHKKGQFEPAGLGKLIEKQFMNASKNF
jgi:hypothetical protein